MTHTLYVFDLHGTLEIGNEKAVVDCTNHVLSVSGFSERLTHQQSHEWYGARWFEYFARLLPEEPDEIHRELQEQAFTFSNTHPEIILNHIRPSPYAHEVLTTIAENTETADQILISNTQEESIDTYLGILEMEPFFPSDKAFATGSHTSDYKDKKQLLRDYLTGKKFKKIVTVGDSPADMGIVNVVNGTPSRRYLFTHPGREFRDCQADHRIRDLREVLRELDY